MRFHVNVMRLLSPKHEDDRVEVRRAINRACAHAEDLSFTTDKLLNGGLQTAIAGRRTLNLKLKPE